MRYCVKNWNKFQHYKNRRPPWIKLQTDTFQDYQFSQLQDASKLLAICIWTLASRSEDASIPDDFVWLKNQCNLSDFVRPEHLKELIDQGFLMDASKMLAGCKQSAMPETERETEKRQRHNNGFLNRKGNGYAKQKPASGKEALAPYIERCLAEAAMEPAGES